MDLKTRGNEYFKHEKFEEALEIYHEALIEADRMEDRILKAQLHSNKAACYWRLGKWKDCVHSCTGALDAIPDYPKALYRRRDAYEALEDWPRSLEDAVRFAKIDPTPSAKEKCSSLRDKMGIMKMELNDSRLPENVLRVLRESADPLEALSMLKYDKTRTFSKKALVDEGAIYVVASLLLDGAATEEVVDKALEFLRDICREAYDPLPRREINLSGPRVYSEGTLMAREALKNALCANDLLPYARNPRICNTAAAVIEFIGHLEHEESLDVLTVAIDAVESDECIGIHVLGAWADVRRRLGKTVKAYVPSQGFLRAFEACVRHTSLSPSSIKNLETLYALTWVLICDKERGPEETLDAAACILDMIYPFLTLVDPDLRANGLMGLAILFHVDTKVGSKILSMKPDIFHIIITACMGHDSDCFEEQQWGADALMYAIRDTSIRKAVCDGDGVKILFSLIEESSTWDRATGVRAEKAHLLKAKVVSMFGMLAAQSEKVKDMVFKSLNFLEELGKASEVLHKMSDVDSRRRLAKAYLECFVMLSFHATFKEILIMNPSSLRSMKSGMVRADDVKADSEMAFFYVCAMHNLLRSRKNKGTPKKKEYPYSEMTDAEIECLEDFYDKLPEAGRPAKSGVVDLGSPELAEKFRNQLTEEKQCVENLNLICSSPASSARTLQIASECYLLLCEDVKRRRQVVGYQAVGPLVRICNTKGEDGNLIDGARHTLARICITTNPAMFHYSEATGMIAPILSLLNHAHDLLVFEAAMAITNLASRDDLREPILYANGWSMIKDLFFSQDYRVQRAGIEAMCNLCAETQIIDMFIDGKADTELKAFLMFAHPDVEDEPTLMAATGALATISKVPEIAEKIMKMDQFDGIMKLFGSELSPALEHRIVSLLASLSTVDCMWNAKGVIRSALQLRRQHGCKSKEAEEIIDSLASG